MTPDEIEHYRARLDQGEPMPYERAVRFLDIAERFARMRDVLEPLRALEAAAWTNRTIEAAARNALPALLREIQETP